MPRYGDWLQTFSGKKFYPFDPRPEDIDIKDIAHCLARMCRYAGHSKEFYSVAEHSVLMARYFPEHAKIAILHDAAEAYFSDIPRPIKRMIPEFERREHHLLSMIFKKYNVAPLDQLTLETIKEMDVYLLWVEKNSPNVMGNNNEFEWDLLTDFDEWDPDHSTIEGWTPAFAEFNYISMLESLDIC